MQAVLNRLVLLSVENLRDLTTSQRYKELASQQLYTLLCFIGHDGRSLHIVCRYEVTDSEPSETTQTNAFRKLQYICGIVIYYFKLFCSFSVNLYNESKLFLTLTLLMSVMCQTIKIAL